MNKLIVKNFGPIKDADIDVKKINLLIGYTSSGKSTIAKLLSIVNSISFRLIQNGETAYRHFAQLLNDYNIDFAFRGNTIIEYREDGYKWIIKKDYFDTNFDRQLKPQKAFLENNHDNNIEIIPERSPVYIPAERILMVMFSNSIFSLLNNDINIPKWITSFGQLYEKARKENPVLSLDMFNVDVKFSIYGDYIIHRNIDKTSIPISQASSGLQSAIPLMSVFNYSLGRDIQQLFVIEEPEMNLFPDAQADLLFHIFQGLNQSENRIIITTHSPYILSIMDNLILANDMASMSKEKEEETMKLLPKDVWLAFENVASYFFQKNGIVEDILDKENRLVGGVQLDELSNQTGNIFDKLLDLKYGM